MRFHEAPVLSHFRADDLDSKRVLTLQLWKVRREAWNERLHFHVVVLFGDDPAPTPALGATGKPLERQTQGLLPGLLRAGSGGSAVRRSPSCPSPVPSSISVPSGSLDFPAGKRNIVCFSILLLYFKLLSLTIRVFLKLPYFGIS